MVNKEGSLSFRCYTAKELVTFEKLAVAQLINHFMYLKYFSVKSLTFLKSMEFSFCLKVDLDLGNYERFLDITLTRDNNITTGKIYQVCFLV
jgi:hypothetical protein